MKTDPSKSHRKVKAGRKAEKRKEAEHKKKGTIDDYKSSKAADSNPRAFAFQSAGKAKARRARSAEKEQRRLHGAPHLLTTVCFLFD
jgi:ribosome biogenesis protein BMS1